MALALMLGITLPVALYRNIPNGWVLDYPQYYMGGTIAIHGEWQDLYPIPKPGSMLNPGHVTESTKRPAYARLAEERHVPESHRFIQLPPVALMLIPNALMPYNVSIVVWIIFCAVCAWGAAWMAGHFYELLIQKESWMSGVITLGIVLLPSTRRSLNSGNFTPIVAFLLSLCIWSLFKRKNVRFATWALIAGLMKYVSVIFGPILVAMRRWKALAWLAGMGIASILISIAIMGTGPFIAFKEIFALTNRPWLDKSNDFYNQAIWSFVFDFVQQNPLPPNVTHAIQALQLFTLAGLFGLMARRKPNDWADPSQVIAATASMICWLLLFSPIYWPHYILYLTPLIGWLVWEARQTILSRVLAIAAIVFISGPYMNVDYGLLSLKHAPLNYYGMWAAVLVMILSVRRLLLKPVPQEAVGIPNK
ncbi:MAG TPA: glycosyltransferase family 87 protein [Tepidisphaeraceae bacterium]|nr:glycosyltransferase family 87 protein [Tepidisphaeraceae bacterium]